MSDNGTPPHEKRVLRVRETYRVALEVLESNDRKIIEKLTALAKENIAYGPEIVKIIKDRLFSVERSKKIPTLYLTDLIVKSLGGDYLVDFSKYISDMFYEAFQVCDDVDSRKQLYKLRTTWYQVFPVEVQREIDRKCNAVDPKWPTEHPLLLDQSLPVIAQTITIPSAHSNIFVNKMFFKHDYPTSNIHINPRMTGGLPPAGTKESPMDEVGREEMVHTARSAVQEDHGSTSNSVLLSQRQKLLQKQKEKKQLLQREYGEGSPSGSQEQNGTLSQGEPSGKRMRTGTSPKLIERMEPHSRGKEKMALLDETLLNTAEKDFKKSINNLKAKADTLLREGEIMEGDHKSFLSRLNEMAQKSLPKTTASSTQLTKTNSDHSDRHLFNVFEQSPPKSVVSTVNASSVHCTVVPSTVSTTRSTLTTSSPNLTTCTSSSTASPPQDGASTAPPPSTHSAKPQGDPRRTGPSGPPHTRRPPGPRRSGPEPPLSGRLDPRTGRPTAMPEGAYHTVPPPQKYRRPRVHGPWGRHRRPPPHPYSRYHPAEHWNQRLPSNRPFQAPPMEPYHRPATLPPLQEDKRRRSPEEHGNLTSAQKQLNIPDLDFDTAQLKRRYDSVIDLMYAGDPCSSCGLRFTTTSNEYKQHLDWHFQRNKVEHIENVRVARKWYLHSEDWLKYEKEVNVSEELSEVCDNSASSGDVSPSLCKVLSDDSGSCTYCGLAIEQGEDEEEEWYFKDAVRGPDGQVYHLNCIQDVKGLKLLSPTAATPVTAPLPDATPPLTNNTVMSSVPTSHKILSMIMSGSLKALHSEAVSTSSKENS